MDFGHTIDRLWALDGDIGTGIPWRRGTKCSNGARTEESEVVHFADFNDVVKPGNVYLQNNIPCK